MKLLISLGILLAIFSTAAVAQRRGLDQLDLLSVSSPAASTNSTASAGPVIKVDLNTFQLLDPLVGYCRGLENSYRAEILSTSGPLDLKTFEKVFREKALAIHRSIFMIKQIQNVSPQVTALLAETDLYGKDISMVLIATQYPNEADAKVELAKVRRKYNASESVDAKELIGTILGRMNANFTRLRVAE